MKKVFISLSSFSQVSDKPLSILNANGCEVVLNPYKRKLTKEECLKHYSDVDGIIAGTERIDKDVLTVANKLRVISRVGVGLDSIDLEYAKTLGIEVYTSQTLPSIAVAELALGLMIDVLRHISQHHAIIKNGEWIKSSGSLIYGKTLGIVGCGRIGKALVSLTKGFEMKYLAFDQEMDIEFGKLHNIRYVDLSYLLNQSDVVSINISKSSDTTDLIGAEELAMMRKDAVFINTARGGIVSEDALVEALRKSEIAGAGIDVFDQEPYVGPLTDLENVVLTPHIGSNAGEIRERMEIDAVNNLIAVLKP